jgi:hypothetical protein
LRWCCGCVVRENVPAVAAKGDSRGAPRACGRGVQCMAVCETQARCP